MRISDWISDVCSSDLYASKLGVNLADLLISQPDTGEQALEITDALVRSGSVDLIVIDSVAALVPKAEIEGDMGDSLPGLQARLMSQARSEEHTSELQSLMRISYAVLRLKKKTRETTPTINDQDI